MFWAHFDDFAWCAVELLNDIVLIGVVQRKLQRALLSSNNDVKLDFFHLDSIVDAQCGTWDAIQPTTTLHHQCFSSSLSALDL